MTRPYFLLEEEQVRATARHDYIRERLASVRRKQEEARRAAEQQHLAAINALLRRQKELVKPVVQFVHDEAGVYPTIARDGTPEFAMGRPVYVKGKPYAVICPVANRVPALRSTLAPLVLFAATESERDRIAAQAAPGQRIEVLEPEPSKEQPPTVPRQPQQDGLTIKEAVSRMFGLDRM